MLMSVLLPEPLDPTSAVVVPGADRNVTPRRTGWPGLYSNQTLLERDVAANAIERLPLRVLIRLGRHVENLANAIESGERFGQLRADRRDRDERRRDQADEEDVHDQIAQRHVAGDDRAPAEEDHQHADDADDDGAARGGGRHAGHRLGDVAEQPVRALGEDDLLALLGGVGLDDPDAAERLGEAAGDFGVDLAALAEQRPQRAERERHPAAEDAEDDQRDGGQPPVQPEQHAHAEHGGDEAADELHEAGADQVPDAFGVGHDARDQDAGLRGIEVADRQPHHVRLHALAHVGDGALRGDAEDLRQPERGDGLHDGRGAGRERERQQQIGAVLADHFVDQPLGRRRQHQSGEAADEHQHEAEAEAPAVRPDELARFAPRGCGADLLFLRGVHREGSHDTTAAAFARLINPEVQVRHAIR